MARRLQGLHTMSKACYVDDEASLQLFESLIEVIEDLEQTELWLEGNEALSAEKSKELLDLHWTLTNMVKDMEKGREEGERIAKERWIS